MQKLLILALFAGLACAATYSGIGSYTLALNDSIQLTSYNLTLADISPNQAKMIVAFTGLNATQQVILTQSTKIALLGFDFELTQINLGLKQASVSVTPVQVTPIPLISATPTNNANISPTAIPNATVLAPTIIATKNNSASSNSSALACIALPETIINTTKAVVVESTNAGFTTKTTIKVKNKGGTSSGDLNVAEDLTPGKSEFNPEPTKKGDGYAEWAFSLQPGQEQTIEITTFTNQQPRPNYNPPQVTVKPAATENSLVFAIIILLIIIIAETAYWQRKKIKHWLKEKELMDN